jgi:hypothetical protein
LPGLQKCLGIAADPLDRGLTLGDLRQSALQSSVLRLQPLQFGLNAGQALRPEGFQHFDEPTDVGPSLAERTPRGIFFLLQPDAIGALRYRISKIDTGFIARWLKEQGAGQGSDVDPTLTTPIADPDETIRALTTAEGPPEPPADRLRRLLTDPDAWTIINN